MLNRSRQAWYSLFPLLTAFKSSRGMSKGARAPLALPAPNDTAREHAGKPEHFLDIPVLDQSRDDRACRQAQERGQFLARQDRWEDLSQEIRDADAARETTPGGMPIAELLAYGARADVIHAVEHALQDGKSGRERPLIEGISMLEELRMEYEDDPFINVIVALAHVDTAWAWRGNGNDAAVPRARRERFAAHFDRAEALMRPLLSEATQSPILASAGCALLAGQKGPLGKAADLYEKLIDLDPQNQRHMRALGNHMLPRWFGSYDELELEARRTASRTQNVWGAGGYTWVCFDAITIDEEACARVDVPFFIDGLQDIIKARPNQEMVNLLAAYCAIALRNGLGLNEEADLARLQIAEAANWLIRDHLTELHPMIWAHAADGFDNNARITSASRFAARGRADALHVIADMFQDEISRGLHVTFTPNGTKLRPI